MVPYERSALRLEVVVVGDVEGDRGSRDQEDRGLASKGSRAHDSLAIAWLVAA